MNRLFCIADTHFFHDNIIKHTGRPDNHNELMIENWNKTIRPQDTVIHLGDVAHGLWKFEGNSGKKVLRKLFDKLNGNRVLVKGNHDEFSDDYYKSLGFATVADFLVKDKILFCHYPLKKDKHDNANMRKIKEDLYKVYMTNQCTTVFHGHSHTIEYAGNHRNFAVELNNYTPQFIGEI